MRVSRESARLVRMTGTLAPAFLYVRRHGRTLDAESITLPDRRRIDRRLLVGAALFGVGWGLSGICPGPGIVLLAGLGLPALVFVSALALGWLVASARFPGVAHGQADRRLR